MALNLQLLLFVILVGAGIVVAVFIYAVPSPVLSPILAVITLVIAVFAFATKYYTYLMVPALKMKGRTIVLSADEPFIIAPNNAAILMHEGQEVYASAFVKIPLYRSATEMTPEEKLDFTRQNSRLVALSREPTRFTAELRVMNKDSYLQIIRDMLNESQNEENKLVEQNAPETDLERARGKSTMWTNMLDVISKTPSLEMGTYATVSGIGTQEFEAVGQAQQRARELMSGVASLFGVTPSIVTGDMLLRFVEPEYMIPYSTITEQIAKGIREQMIK